MGNLARAAYFIVDTLFSIYLTVILLRILLQWVRADYYNPLSQGIIRVTDPVIRPLRPLIPNRGRLDFGALLALFALQLIATVLLMLIASYGFNPIALLLTTFVKLVQLIVYTLIFIIILRAILSFFPNQGGNPVHLLSYQITEPLLAPVRRMLPPMGGFDLSPLIVILLLQLTLILLGIG